MAIPALELASDAELRASRAFELVLLDRLPAGERELLSDLEDRSGIYGVARRRDGGGSMHVVGCDAALLLLSLQDPGLLPGFARTGDGSRQVAELVLDGLLEVYSSGRFVSGPEALCLLGDANLQDTQGGGPIKRLTERTLRYAARLPLNDAETLAWRLYAYHRLPLTADWRRRLPGAEAVAAFVGAGPGGTAEETLARHWRHRPSKKAGGWIFWRRRGGSGRSQAAEAPTYKLYVSPRPEAFPEAFAAAAETLATTAAFAFKIGDDALGVLRPDKMVAYFTTFEDLSRAAERLASRLAGLPAHGVPFTAEIDGDGLLSWGVDPPRSQRLLPRTQQESWRVWVATRLAAALTCARAHPSDEVPAWRFARERVRLEGVDVDTWTPSQTLFDRPLEN